MYYDKNDWQQQQQQLLHKKIGGEFQRCVARVCDNLSGAFTKVWTTKWLIKSAIAFKRGDSHDDEVTHIYGKNSTGIPPFSITFHLFSTPKYTFPFNSLLFTQNWISPGKSFRMNPSTFIYFVVCITCHPHIVSLSPIAYCTTQAHPHTHTYMVYGINLSNTITVIWAH